MKGMGRIAAAVAAAAVLVVQIAVAAPGDVQTAPFHVASPGYTPDVAAAANGKTIHVWTENVSFAPQLLRARLYTAAGAPGAAFTVYTVDPGTRGQIPGARVAADAAGNFVVVWETASDDSVPVHRIFLRRYSADGVALSPALAVDDSVEAALDQVSPSIAMNATGQFAVSWSSLRRYAAISPLLGDLRITQGPIFMRRYDSSGAAYPVQKVSDRQSGSYETGSSVYGVEEVDVQLQYASRGPAINIGSAGETVVAWTAGFRLMNVISVLINLPQLGGGVQTVYAQRFDASGSAQGKRIEIDSALTNAYEVYDAPAVALTPDGGFVVAYARNDALRAAAIRRGLYFIRVDAAGKVPRNPTEVVRGVSPACCDRTFFDGAPSIAVHSSGGFAIAWRDFGEGGSTPSQSVSTRVFASNGSALGQIRHFANYFYVSSVPRIAMLANGDYFLSWAADEIVGNATAESVEACRIDGP